MEERIRVAEKERKAAERAKNQKKFREQLENQKEKEEELYLMFKAEMEEEENLQRKEEIIEVSPMKSKTADSNIASSRRNLEYDEAIEEGTATVHTVDNIITSENLFRKKRNKRNIYRGRSSNVCVMQQHM